MYATSVFCVLEVVWLCFVGYGIATHRGLPHGDLPLAPYDRILRTYGPVLPFAPLLLRALLQYGLHHSQTKNRNEKSKMKLKSDPFEAFKVYCMITTIRWILYSLHLILIAILKRLNLEEQHFVSDHIVLGASMIAIFQLEISIVLSHKKLKNDLLMELVVVVLNSVLFLLTCGDMFYTAWYFHPRLDSVVGLLQGGLLQFGGLYFLSQDANRNHQ